MSVRESSFYNHVDETLNRSQLEAIQDERLRNIVRHTQAHNAFFADHYKEAGVDAATFKGLEDLEKLPFMSKKDFRTQYPDGMCCVDRSKIIEMHMSSGTSGTPVVMLYTQHDLDQWAECMARCYVMAGMKKTDTIQITPGFGLFNGGFGCYHGARAAGLFIVPAGPGNTERQVRLAHDMKTNGFVCVVSYATRIMEVREKMGVELPNLRVAICGAESFTPEMKTRLREGLGVEPYDIYGMTETGGIGTLGQDCQYHNGIHVWEDHYIVEIIDPVTLKHVPDGEIGELAVTALTREAIPVIRFRTGDLTRVVSKDCCECGRTHVRLDTIKGRIDDMLIIKGVNFFPAQVEQALLKIKGVLPNYRMIINEVNGVKNLRVEVEAEKGVTGYMVEKQLKETLGFSPDGDIFAPGTLPQTEGKAKRVFFQKDGVDVPKL
ncbi:MAG: phenylacetate--CoA ligase [Lentisphaeria bacterium]|nr:phenylacetate--CoA ligase [Lentisphaeria bacterium]